MSIDWGRSTVIEVQNLSFCYEGFEALHSVSFCLRRGEIAGLLGPNGAGKTTAIKILAGILCAGSGRVVVGGFELPEQHLDAKKIIGYVPEAAGVYESLSGTEFLELSGRLHGIEEKTLQNRICVLLEAFELDAGRGLRLAGYSKGMRQKILLSAALLHDPEILILDEPLSGLDVTTSILIKDLLAAVAARGKTVLYSSHVLDVVEKVCHRALIIDRGHLVADAPVEELKARAMESSLEKIFRKLTHSENSGPKIERILEALES
jgi:ABC-2 type transport system ATP-binding protein